MGRLVSDFEWNDLLRMYNKGVFNSSTEKEVIKLILDLKDRIDDLKEPQHDIHETCGKAATGTVECTAKEIREHRLNMKRIEG